MNGGWAAAITGSDPCRARMDRGGHRGTYDPAARRTGTGRRPAIHPIRRPGPAPGARVIVACPEALIRLVARCPGVDAVEDWYGPIPECDVQAMLMSLPAILGTTQASLPGEFPYLAPDVATVDRWRPIVERSLASIGSRGDEDGAARGRIFRIGIAWQGNPCHRNDRCALLPADSFRPPRRVAGRPPHQLAEGTGTEQLADLAGRFPVAVLPGCRARRGRPPRLPRHGGHHESGRSRDRARTRPLPTWRGVSGSGPGSRCPPCPNGDGCWTATIPPGIRP